MKAVGFTNSLPIEDANSLFDFELADPVPNANDILVAVEAVSINPADAKRRLRTAVDAPHETPLILGYDAVGVVKAMGPNVDGFGIGDRVWYAGDANRPGSYAELQCVDYRIASKAPSSVAVEQAAAMPLTSITAWEILFDRLNVPTDEQQGSLLVIGGAGGVGSITTQLARKLTGLNVIATASRPETIEWCKKLGAHHVVNHYDLMAGMQAIGQSSAEYIVQYADTAQHWDAMCELVAPQGKIGTIVETDEKLDISALQGKSASLNWELMFTRSMFNTSDMHKQGKVLARIASLVDDGIIQTTETMVLDGLSAVTLKKAHQIVETASMIGKLVVKY